MLGRGIAAIGAALDIDQEWNRNPYLPEDVKAADALATGLGDAASFYAGDLAGTAAMAGAGVAVAVAGGPVGLAVVGAVVVGVAVGTVANTVIKGSDDGSYGSWRDPSPVHAMRDVFRGIAATFDGSAS